MEGAHCTSEETSRGFAEGSGVERGWDEGKGPDGGLCSLRPGNFLQLSRGIERCPGGFPELCPNRCQWATS